MRLKGKNVTILIADGYHEHEFWFPYYRFREEGADVLVAAPEAGIVYGEGRHGKDGLEAEALVRISDLPERLPDILFLPGGIYGPLSLRVIPGVLNYVRRCMDEGKLVCAICHAPWILVSAGVVKGKAISAPRDMAEDITGSGGIYSPEKVSLDGNLLSAHYYACLPEMFRVLFDNMDRLLPVNQSLP